VAVTPDDVDVLTRLVAFTSGRTRAQHGMLPGGPTPYDLVFDVPFSKIINGAFSYPGNVGARFSLPRWGAWYAGRDPETACAEVAFRRGVLLVEAAVAEDEMTYVDLVADIHGDLFADLRDGTAESQACLDPASYVRGQALAEALLERGYSGVVYPSVRHDGGECVACLRPSMIANVRVGGWYSLRWSEGHMAVTPLE
jgi:RES domain-containing protein